MMARLGVLSALLTLGACDPTPTSDQCMRVQLFSVCMSALPVGPNTVKYNDWAEVVGECDAVAYKQSVRAIAQIKAECRPL